MRTRDLERLFSEHAKPLVAFLAFRCGDRGLAEDVLADTFERALRARGRFDERKASEKTWLYAIAINRLRDQVRRRKVERRAIERMAVRLQVAGDEYARIAARDELHAALARLPSEEREVIVLRFGAELTVAEMARALGKPRTTVEGRLYRGLQRLRDRLAPGAHQGDPGPAGVGDPALAGEPAAAARSGTVV